METVQKELEAKTDIEFTYEPIRVGRSIQKIKFKIRSDPKNKNLMINITEKMEKLFESEDVIKI